jgi:fatty acid desaturase
LPGGQIEDGATTAVVQIAAALFGVLLLALLLALLVLPRATLVVVVVLVLIVLVVQDIGHQVRERHRSREATKTNYL